jgi:transcriptional regulator with XRE-family HTH domain
MDSEATVSDLIAKRVRELRTGQGMTVKQLAARCTEVGVRLSEQALYKLEGQREAPGRPARPVTVDELLGLAYVLDVAPVYLIAGLGDDDEQVPITPQRSASAGRARKWIRGMGAVPGINVHRFDLNRPSSEANTTWFAINAANLAEAEFALKAAGEFVSLQRWRQEHGEDQG